MHLMVVVRVLVSSVIVSDVVHGIFLEEAQDDVLEDNHFTYPPPACILPGEEVW